MRRRRRRVKGNAGLGKRSIAPLLNPATPYHPASSCSAHRGGRRSARWTTTTTTTPQAPSRVETTLWPPPLVLFTSVAFVEHRHSRREQPSLRRSCVIRFGRSSRATAPSSVDGDRCELEVHPQPPEPRTSGDDERHSAMAYIYVKTRQAEYEDASGASHEKQFLMPRRNIHAVGKLAFR